MSLGETHWNWRPDVAANVRRIEARFPAVRCNTYEGHPWRGWDGQSIDVWARGGRGDPLPRELALAVRNFVFTLRGDPFIRHYIVEHELWTSFGGVSHWHRNDHTGRLRHFHVTYW